MIRGARVFILSIGLLVAVFIATNAQTKIDEQRMQRDIEVAENILTTLIKQEFSRRNFFPIEITGEYREGHGVTFRLPEHMNGTMRMFMNEGFDNPNIIMNNSADGFSYSISSSGFEEETNGGNDVLKAGNNPAGPTPPTPPKVKSSKNKKAAVDTAAQSFDQKFIEASKNFMVDYGDLISQLQPNEKITITNRGDNQNPWFRFQGNTKQSLISIEAIKSDLTLAKQGKITREQLLSKIKLVNSELSDKLEPDLELFSSIFGRLYQPDLSKTFYTQGNIYYERLKDYGAVFYMESVSSNQGEFFNQYAMPTLGLDDVDQATRDKKVKELYPVFEKELKENILEYGRTLKSLKDEENLVFNAKITRCKGCGIPSSLEIVIKMSVLKEYSTSKITKEAALAKMMIKKGANQ
jgi:hypothetical protein